MDHPHSSLNDLIARVRSHIKTRVALKGVVITLAVAIVSFIAASYAAASWNRTAIVFLLRLLPLLLTSLAAWFFIVRPLRAPIADSRIARLIEEKSGLQDRLVTAVEFADATRDASPVIVERLINDTRERTATAEIKTIVNPRPAYAYGAGAMALLLGLALLFTFAPVSGKLTSLYSNIGGDAMANAMYIAVTPGTARAPRGSDQKIKATLNGFNAQTAQVFMRKLGTENWVASVMEPAKNQNEFQFVIFNIQDSITYYVEADGTRSPEYALDVADLPYVKQIDLVLDFPAYTGISTKKIENGAEITALKGTTVTVIAHLSMKAKAARIVLSDGTKIEMAANPEHADNQFTGAFTIKQNGTYRIEVTSEDGERYNGSNEYDIVMLEDNPPVVTLDKPGRDMKVTSIQEIFTQARAEDDYGVVALEFYYSVNGGEEKKVQLQDLKRDAPKTLSGSHTFFLEELGLQPGDFVSYYAKARDNGSGGEATSDIYFMEVRPFDREFRQAQQQGGGGGGEESSNALTRRQREIIAATFRVQRDEKTYATEEKEENFNTVTLSQEKLKADTETLAERIRRRLGGQMEGQSDFAKIVEHLTQAAKEMEAATNELKARKSKEAMSPEQRALQQLLRAEAVFRDVQIARGQGDGGGGQQEQDLADLFELQLDKMKNQYETLKQGQQQQQNQQQDELAKRLQELARRQQQQLEQRMRAQQQQQGGGGGGSQRQQQEMIEEAKRMARELEKLARDRRDPKLAEAAQQMQRAAEEMQRAQSSASSSSSSNSSEATAQSLRAIERMEQARRSLDNSRSSGNQQSLQNLRQRAEEAKKRQEEIARKVDDLVRSGQGASEEQKQQLAESKETLAENLSGLERDIEQTARGMGQERQPSSDKLREAVNSLRRNRVTDKIQQSNQMLRNGWFDQARERERIIQNNIDDVVKNLQAAEGAPMNRNQGDALADALNRAREITDNLESLRRRGESQQGDNQNGQQPNQSGQQNGQQGQPQNQNGQRGQSGQQQNSQANGQQSGQQGQPQNRPGQQAGQKPNQQGQRSQSGQRGQQGQQQGGQQGRQGQRSQSGQQGQQSQSGQQGQQGQESGQQQGGQGGQQSSGQQQNGQQQGGQRGQQPGGQSSQQGQQQGGQQGQQGQTSNNPTMNPSATGGGPPRGSDRQIESELRQRIGELEELRRQLGRDPELARDLNQALEQLRKINPNAFSDPAQLALLKNEVIEPLRQLELNLARKLQARLGNNGVGSLSDGDAPDRYRKVIEDYYRRLSSRSPDTPRP